MRSYSIKDVLTPLVPDLTYKGMEVADGMTASVRLFRLMADGNSLTPEQREAERRVLLEYCKMDTLAMVKLWVGGGGSRWTQNSARSLPHLIAQCVRLP